MADDVDLTPDEASVLEAVTRLEARDDTATVRRVAEETGMDPHRAEEVLGRLATTHDLVREHRAELDGDATGVGRVYTIKSRPAPR